MKKHSPVHRFLIRLALISLPIWAVVALYVVLDPFKVVWHYDNFYERQEPHPTLDVDYVSCENYVQRNDTTHYNAFLMGNSRSQFWQIDDWLKHLPEGTKACHYYGNGETLYRLTRHLQFLHERKASLDHVVMVIDRDLLEEYQPQTTGHLGLMPPKTDGRLLLFHAENFLAFIKPTFLVGYIDYRLFGKMRPYMTENFLFEQPIDYDPVTNEMREYLLEEAIANGTYYTPEKISRFSDKQFPDSVSPPVLGKEHETFLRKIQHIFDLHHTDYRIVVSPLYNQIRLNSSDLAMLQSVFGTDHIYDFSGPNQWNSDYHLFYEENHYRPIVARQLMDAIYP